MTTPQSALPDLTIAFQPICQLATRAPIGYEALLRGPGGRPIPVLAWIDQAAREGWLPRLLHRAWALAAQHAGDVLRPSEVLFVNWDQRAAPPPRLPWPKTVVELSERLPLTPDAVAALHALGARVAMDDFGHGVTTMRVLTPPGVDVIKLDMTIVRGVDRDPARRALLRGLVDLCLTLAPGVWIIAEGIETEGELQALVDCGISLGQGFLLGVPELAPAFRAPATQGAPPGPASAPMPPRQIPRPRRGGDR
ncbi:MAG: EAL domain-containing protein [Firmicutes bacterium]|nr:EAL domain-containing protein [Alicyclobacillaceae bacterium]MCL6498381.1 EAL domain-containing protein [Bacillota bacterium]